MEKYIELEKRQKKAQKEYYNSLRGKNGFNTGTRTMQTEKNPIRAKQKVLDRKEIKEYN